MGRKKLIHFKELQDLSNVYEFPINMAGFWHKNIFKNKKNIVLELGCGAGDYTIGLAALDTGKNYIGVDIQGERIWYGAKTGLEKNLENVRFLRTYVQKLPEYFTEQEVSQIWITFADPHIKSRKANKRLTSPYFLDIYTKILEQGGIINLKTDSELLYQYTLEVLGNSDEGAKYKIMENIEDVHSTLNLKPELQILTYYEKKHIKIGKKIKYLSFKLIG